MEIILASKSPRRRELMKNLGITDFAVIPAEFESEPPAGAPPDEAVRFIAAGKAREVAARHENALVIAADTLVYLDGEPLGKPESGKAAREMLRRLSGREHDVYTGVCVMARGREALAAERTRVKFRELEAGEIDAYVATGEPMDKAGAYGAQGKGSTLVERIDGDFFNVMGLPVCRLYMMLRELGYTF